MQQILSEVPLGPQLRQSTIVSLADRALQSKQQADVKLAQAVANVQEAVTLLLLLFSSRSISLGKYFLTFSSGTGCTGKWHSKKLEQCKGFDVNTSFAHFKAQARAAYRTNHKFIFVPGSSWSLFPECSFTGNYPRHLTFDRWNQVDVLCICPCWMRGPLPLSWDSNPP